MPWQGPTPVNSFDGTQQSCYSLGAACRFTPKAMWKVGSPSLQSATEREEGTAFLALKRVGVNGRNFQSPSSM
jgi:hypothetical protein